MFQSAAVSPHDLLRIRSAADLRCDQPLPAWVYVSLQRACWVVVRRSLPHNEMVPVGVRGLSREQRFAVHVPISAVLDRVAPEQLVYHRGWEGTLRHRNLPAYQTLDLISHAMSDFGLVWGPTGSIGFEMATGVATATMPSDLDLLIRAPRELSRDLCRRICARILERLPARVDALIETGAGAIAFAEFAQGNLPILFRSPAGPKLVYRPWEIADEHRLCFSRAGISGRGNVAFSPGSSSGICHA